MSYSLKNTAQTSTFIVNDNTENSTSTSLIFIGKNYVGYGLALNENFLYLLENFSNIAGSYPANPVAGQLFWDNTNKYMHVYDGAAWKVIYGALNSLTVNTSISTANLTVTNTAITGYSTKDINILGGSTNNIYLIGNTGQGVYNGLVNAGDMLLGFNAATQGTGNLVIAPWSSAASGSGIKIKSVSNVATITLQSPTTTVSGNLAIGLTTPLYTLDVKGPSNEYRTAIFESASTLGPSVQIKGSKIYELRSTDSGASEGAGLFFIYDKDNNTSRLTVNSSGYIGIGGITSPTAPLDVNGNITARTANVYGANLIANTATYSNAYYYSNGSPFLGGAKFTTSNTAPGGANAGDMWYQGNTDILFVNIKDASNNNYWIDTTTTPSAFANISVTNSLYPSSNASVTLGSATAYWSNVYAVNFLGTSTTAKYADLAEKYRSDFPYEPGTIVVFGGSEEVTVTDISHSNKVAGVVSTNPAYMMNSDADGLYVALQGRVPCRVFGPLKKGQMIVTSHVPGVGCGVDDYKYVPGCVIGKSLVDVFDNQLHVIEVAVGRL